MMRPFLVLLLGLFCVCPSISYSSDESVLPSIRVLIAKDLKDFTVSVGNKFKIIDPRTQEVLYEGKRLKDSKVNATDYGINVGEYFFVQRHIRIISENSFTITSKGIAKRYRGGVDVISGPLKKIYLINDVEIETYIRGVLYHEVTDRWPIEAIKAQAVAARTYAYFQRSQNKNNEFDLTNDIYSQVYGGRSAERYRTNIAVKKTEGEVLYFEGKILPAYFHANCGGQTENVKELWEDQKNLTPLWGVVCPYCKDGPAYSWKRNFRLQDFQEKLVKAGYSVGVIQEISIVDKNESGRNEWLLIKSRDGRQLKMEGKKFREIIGPNVIRSNNYDIVMKGYYCDLIGKGWGHGVGMCQWGAYAMSVQRFTYQQILSFYYPGSEIVTTTQK